MKRLSAIILFLAALPWGALCCFADNDPYIQYLPEYMPQAPNAQAIARAVDIPVNYYTGIPNITIPLYNIEVGNLSVPISLSYQGGGIRPSQEATSVGLGWTLNAGGAITRTVKCADDFMEHPVSGSQFVYGFLQKAEWPDLSVSFDYNYYRKIQDETGILGSYSFCYLCVDSEPDIFFYDIPNNGGKFSYKKDSSIVYFEPSNNVKILSSSYVNPLFSATDALGTVYTFDTKERTKVFCGGRGNEYVNTTTGGADILYEGSPYLNLVSDYTSTWYLTSMISMTNDTISFIYEDESFQLPLQESCRYINRIEGSSLSQEGNGTRYNITKNYVYGKRLKKIIWREGYVIFEYGTSREDLAGIDSDTPRKLEAVKVYNSDDNLVCHWKMTYHYFNSGITGVAGNRKHLFKRLCLDSVQNMLTEQRPYSFSYYDSVPLPSKNTKNLDYWGYYNGSNQGNNYYCQTGNSTIKAANEYYSKIGVLESIEYPTGGVTNLQWESNKINEAIINNETKEKSEHKSYTKGFLQVCDGGGIELETERSMPVLLTDSAEIYLLLSSRYVVSHTYHSSGGFPFSIEKVNESGPNTLCYSWEVTTIGDEFERTVKLGPGVYLFKCIAATDVVEYSMFFIDSKDKNTIKKNKEGSLLCCKESNNSRVHEIDSATITLEHENVVVFNYSGYPINSTAATSTDSIAPFSISKRNAGGDFELVHNWILPNDREKGCISMCLEAGTYKIECEAILQDWIYTLSYSYGALKYSPVDITYYEKNWDSRHLTAYKEGSAHNSHNSPEEMSDTLVVENSMQIYIDWLYMKTSNTADIEKFVKTYPFNVYKKNNEGTFEKILSVSGECMMNMDKWEQQVIGLYLDAGTYSFKCEATVEDILLYVGMAHKNDKIKATAGNVRGGLRIAKIKGEKNITYLYEGGKALIPPCTYYKENHVYDDAIVTYSVQPSESVRPLSTLKNGNIIGYSKVLEIFDDRSRNEYTYHNEEEELEDADYPYSPSHTDWENGLLLTKLSYDANGDSISLTSNSYTSFVTTPNYRVGFMEVRPGNMFYYYNTVKCPKLTHSTQTNYCDNGDLVTRRAFSYNSNLLCSEETTQRGYDTHKTVYKYATEFSDTISQQMVRFNMVGVPIATMSMRNGVFYDGTRTIYGNFNHLNLQDGNVTCGTHTRNDSRFCQMYLPQKLLTLNTSISTGDFGSCRFDTTIVYNSYTRYGKVQELNYKGMPITYLWSYHGMYPVAEVKNATYQQFMANYTTPSLSGGAIYSDPLFVRDNLWNAGTALSGTSMQVCLYKPLVGLTEVTDNREERLAYDYDEAGRLQSSQWVDFFSTSPETLQTVSYDNNFVRTTTYPTFDTDNSYKTIQYYDAWGRPSLYAAQGIKQDGTFSYSLQTYDALGRPSLSYVPIPSNSMTGDSISTNDFVELSANVFSGDHYGYVRTSYDALGRPSGRTTPGRAWADNNKSTTIQYLTNAANEVKYYGMRSSSLALYGYYPAGTLDCTVTTDPDGQTVKTYKDVFGNVVLERRAGGYNTYYAYDNHNRLRFVLPPKYQEEENLGYYAYQYIYDGRGRVVKKTLPGCQTIQYWYDNADRLIKMQDGVLAQAGCYRVWTYDGLGRQLSQRIESAAGMSYNEMLHFYDNYNFVNSYASLFPAGVSNMVPAGNTYSRGQLTGVWQRTNNGESLLSVLGYDGRGFLAKKTSTGEDGRISVSDYLNNLTGDIVQESFREYRPNAAGTLECLARGTVENNYDYLHTNLLTSSVITIYDKSNNMLKDTIQHLTYDDFGHIWKNNRSGSKADMTYSYDQMHGWLQGISSAGGFEQRLYRETEGHYPCYNGNISAMSWKTGNSYLRRFDYKYNAVNWLEKADFSYYRIGNAAPGLSPTLTLMPYVGMDNEDYTSEYDYDMNGNLTGAYRQGMVNDDVSDPYHTYDTMDDYVVEYNGNQKRSVNGTGAGNPSYFGSSSFVDGMPEGDNEYAYNANGAMTKDMNKGINDITYDLLGNLREITMSDNRSIRYVYAADGTRLRTTHKRKVGNTYLRDSTEYLGNLIVKNGQPVMYRFSGGYFAFDNGALSDCHYYIQDYLGSNRMVVSKGGSVKQSNHYYPYGGIIGGIDFNPTLQPYKFEDKELDRTYGLDWYDIHARQYDPVVPSWHTIDPLAEKYYYISPYAYCANNPVNSTDTDGKKIVMGKNNSPEYNHQYNNAVNYLKEHGCSSIINYLESIETVITVNEIDSKNQNYTDRRLGINEIGWKAKEGLLTDTGQRLSPAIRLFHEFAHQEHKLKNPHKFLKDTEAYNSVYQNVDDENIIKNEESSAARSCGEIPQDAVSRESHGGISFETSSSTSRIILNSNDDIEIWKLTWEDDDVFK